MKKWQKAVLILILLLVATGYFMIASTVVLTKMVPSFDFYNHPDVSGGGNGGEVRLVHWGTTREELKDTPTMPIEHPSVHVFNVNVRGEFSTRWFTAWVLGDPENPEFAVLLIWRSK